jgi:two-component system response regulator AtoC
MPTLDTDGVLPTRSVLVHDPRVEQARRVLDAATACHLTPHWIADASAIASLSRGDDYGIALVAVTGEPIPGSPVLEAVAHLKRTGYTVLCYWAAAGQWALGAQCRLLLAGASHLLDGTDAAFATDLRERLAHIVAAAAERQREDRRIKQEMLRLDVVGASAAITGVFRWVLRVGPLSDLPVLISGETGTGKEMVARAIHRLDPRRREGPFVPVNCAAINAGLAESELFGHRRGAFTGAEHDRQGLVRAARGGVLFLDEVGDLDANLQGKLLRVLQEHRVLALGADQEEPVDVRIIAATNRDLDDGVRSHAFRADLFHRLGVLSVHVPALRERPEDVEPLVRHFIARYGHAPDRVVSASGEFVQALGRVALPGNVRQLENLVRRALVGWKPADPLRLSDLPPELWSELADEPGRVKAPEPGGDGRPGPLDAMAVLEASSWKLGRALALCEQRIVGAALGASRGNRSRAARLLGISPRSIFNKIRKYQLDV